MIADKVHYLNTNEKTLSDLFQRILGPVSAASSASTKYQDWEYLRTATKLAILWAQLDSRLTFSRAQDNVLHQEGLELYAFSAEFAMNVYRCCRYSPYWFPST